MINITPTNLKSWLSVRVKMAKTLYLREREREFNRTFVSLYDIDCGDDKKRRRQDKWEAYLCENNNQTEIEPIDFFFPRRINFSGNDRTHLGGLKGKYTYGRIFIRKKGGK